MTGCGYNKTVFYTIEPSQTAFVIDLFGDNTEQSIFASEEMLRKSMVSTKEVPVDHKWIKTGYMPWSGYWKERYKVIVVERKPVTREWNSGNNSGNNVFN